MSAPETVFKNLLNLDAQILGNGASVSGYHPPLRGVKTIAPIISLGAAHPSLGCARMKKSWLFQDGLFKTPMPGWFPRKGQCRLRLGAQWSPSQPDLRKLTDKLMDKISALVTGARKESQCVSPTSLNPIPQW